LIRVADVVDAGPLRLDRRTRRATLHDQDLPLTTYEFELLLAFAVRAGRVLSREQLVELVRGSADQAFERSIDVHVSRLRQKLGDDPKNPRILKTVRGVGYLLALS
jgi:DNA-binding response OmpR family regulator